MADSSKHSDRVILSDIQVLKRRPPTMYRWSVDRATLNMWTTTPDEKEDPPFETF
jgi:hypothetical protein